MEIPVAVDSSSPPPPPPWIELPEDLTANILQRLGVDEILVSAEAVCTTWRRVCHNPAMWRVIHIKNAGDVYNYYQLDVMCRISVDRSQGQMINLSIDKICDDELLNYTVQRSSGLRCLTLNCCFRISGKDLIKAVEKLEHLEELHLIHLKCLDAGDVETIGVSCPMLKSFTCNECFSRNSDFALAIAKTMTNLIHLRLVENAMKKEALEAILDCCSHLELLDLRRCVGLDLQGDLAKRCSEQIKDLILPFDIGSEYDSLYQACHPYNPIGCEYIGRCDVYDFNRDSYFDDDDDDDYFYYGSCFVDDDDEYSNRY